MVPTPTETEKQKDFQSASRGVRHQNTARPEPGGSTAAPAVLYRRCRGFTHDAGCARAQLALLGNLAVCRRRTRYTRLSSQPGVREATRRGIRVHPALTAPPCLLALLVGYVIPSSSQPGAIRYPGSWVCGDCRPLGRQTSHTHSHTHSGSVIR